MYKIVITILLFLSSFITSTYSQCDNGVILNEIYNGPSNAEYFELLTTGTSNINLTGYILDDNNFEAYDVGTEPGHIRLGDCLSDVPPGTFIVIYNDRLIHGQSFTPTGLKPGTIAIPFNSPCIIQHENCPGNSSFYVNHYDCPPLPTRGNGWRGLVPFRDLGDVAQLRSPDGTLINAIGIGSGVAGKSPKGTVVLPTPVEGMEYWASQGYSLQFDGKSDDLTDVHNFRMSKDPTPGQANGKHNTQFIENAQYYKRGSGGEENTVTLCQDGIDNDCDGLADCDDEDCMELSICTTIEPCIPTDEIEYSYTICNDGIDNDCDGLIDCDDPDCQEFLICSPDPSCEILSTLQIERIELFKAHISFVGSGSAAQYEQKLNEMQVTLDQAQEIINDLNSAEINMSVEIPEFDISVSEDIPLNVSAMRNRITNFEMTVDLESPFFNGMIVEKSYVKIDNETNNPTTVLYCPPDPVNVCSGAMQITCSACRMLDVDTYSSDVKVSISGGSPPYRILSWSTEIGLDFLSLFEVTQYNNEAEFTLEGGGNIGVLVFDKAGCLALCKAVPVDEDDSISLEIACGDDCDWTFQALLTEVSCSDIEDTECLVWSSTDFDIDQIGTEGSTCLDHDGTITLEVISNGDILRTYTFDVMVDEPGDDCDDGNDCTENDVITENCGCIGTPKDKPCDCPQTGEGCDDGNDCTINDVINEFCECVGTFQPDPNMEEICDNGIDDDCDGLIDCEDDDCCQDIACIFKSTSNCLDHCFNAVQDEDEMGIDCGGIDCIPCETLCMDCDQNGCRPMVSIDSELIDTDSCGRFYYVLSAMPFGDNYIYSWNNGKSTDTIHVVNDDKYKVTVTNQYNCTGNAEIEVPKIIEICDRPMCVPMVTIDTLQEGCDCCITLEVSPNESNFLYSWNNNLTGSKVNVCKDGDYKVTVTNEFGCTGKAQISVNINEPSNGKYSILAIGGITGDTVMVTNNGDIYTHDCDMTYIDYELIDANGDICADSVYWTLDGIEICKGLLTCRINLGSSFDQEIKAYLCSKEIIKITKKTYSKKPEVYFRRGDKIAGGTYDGEYGYDDASQPILLAQGQYDADRFVTYANTYYYPNWLTLLDSQKVVLGIEVDSLPPEAIKDPNFQVTFMAKSTNDVIQIDSNLILNFNYNSLSKKNQIEVSSKKIIVANINDKMFIHVTDQCMDTIGRLVIASGIPTEFKVKLIYIDHGLGYPLKQPKDIILHLNKKSHNQLFRKWVVDSIDSLDITSMYQMYQSRLLNPTLAIYALDTLYMKIKGVSLPSEGYCFISNMSAISSGANGVALTTTTRIAMYDTASDDTYAHEFGHALSLRHSFKNDNVRSHLDIPQSTTPDNYMDYPIGGAINRNMFYLYQMKYVRK